ncbi:acyl-CoA synthetase [Actinoplanes sp. SE50]|uniref:long-chain-fatty-acid--CoA ligase n=1 Tax=unclassified Actinoplanes TaxID=2626549 RepID=UPI00023ED0D5|nr:MULTISPECIES: long-chain fatty acid--CoA ligase [unclassified Actinoplanes]AEV86091.1 AMP-dependent synthetase and ligase [Actinoplanes sp. SE50/110]ATO84489.1 acyl-CoA synthetase [Actinoplanes sp. SE50]SLM01899.1 long-chain-fatty-acid--CoA ligase [Actinoplanes sp. SE50/110]
MLNLSILLEDSARRHPDRAAVVLGPQRLTYAQVEAAAGQVANMLVARGIQPGDRVALSCPNLPYFPIVYYGILKAGAVVVPLNVLLKGREITYHLKDSQATAYFCFEGTAELPMGVEGRAGFEGAADCEHFFLITADPAAASPIEGTETLGQALAGHGPTFETVLRAETDAAVILYTSGTTGQAKGAELSHSNLVLNALTCNRLFNSQPATDTHLLVLPLFHSFGSTVNMNAGFSVAATLVLLPRFEANAAVRLLQDENVTFFAGVPTMYWGLLNALSANEGVDVERIAANMRVAVSGGSSLPIEIIKAVRERFGVTILEGYGLSETSPVATFSDPDGEPRPGSIGIPIWGVEVKLIDAEWNTVTGVDEIGEIAIRGHNIMKGYYNRPEATAEVMRDGWFRSGDLARRDKDGFYYIVDRAKDMIIRGGFNVYPREIEEVLLTHEAVSLAAVIGVAHPSHGEEVKAYVILKPGASATEDELVAWSREQMASYKYPRIVKIVESLPMTATGKLLKRELD